MSNQWVFDLESTLLSIVKTRAKKKLVAKYPNIFFTNNDKSTSDPKFPTVYIHELPGAETGMDLDGTTINAVIETVQVDVTTNTKQQDAKAVMAVVADEFKTLRFQITSMPEFTNDDDTYRTTARFRRTIGSGDSLN